MARTETGGGCALRCPRRAPRGADVGGAAAHVRPRGAASGALLTSSLLERVGRPNRPATVFWFVRLFFLCCW